MAAQTPDFRHQTSDTGQSEDNSDFSRIENTLKIICLVKKVVKKQHFLVIISTKTRYSSLNSLARGTKVGFKLKYNCYMLQIQVLKFFIGNRCCDIRV
jgi:hypothetical protein